MRNKLNTFGLLLGLSFSFAQSAGEKAVGVIFSKDGLLALSGRFTLGGNPYLNLAFVGGYDRGWGLTAGVAFQQYINTAVCEGGVCGRGMALSPYLEGGFRVRQGGDRDPAQALAHLGGGILLPIRFMELFAQANLYTLLSPAKPRLDVAGGLRVRI
ncbi:MAG: hypothetical protein N2170_03255 [Bacteroidia bacterium]|nr:hypothetical protein [Bacteroidia bacterium]